MLRKEKPELARGSEPGLGVRGKDRANLYSTALFGF